MSEDFENKLYITTTIVTNPLRIPLLSNSFLNKYYINLTSKVEIFYVISKIMEWNRKPSFIVVNADMISTEIYNTLYLNYYDVVKMNDKTKIQFNQMDNHYNYEYEPDDTYISYLTIPEEQRYYFNKKISGFDITFYRNDHLITKENYAKNKLWEPYMLDLLQHFYKGGDIIDIGAHIGSFSLFASRVIDEGNTVHCFEPVHYEVLEKNLKNNCNNCLLYKMGLNNSAGEIEIRVPDFKKHGNMGETVLDEKIIEHNETIDDINRLKKYTMKRVRFDRLDDVIPPEIRVGIIKIDVEGMEMNVIEGGKRLFESCDHVIFECLVTSTESPVIKYFKSIGRECVRISNVDWISVDGNKLKKYADGEELMFFSIDNIGMIIRKDFAPLKSSIVNINGKNMKIDINDENTYTWVFKI